MSNVLIGIIGVILFIGLALAGALFLGPRFQEATQNSKASAYVEAMKQVAHAAELYQLDNGSPAPLGGASGLVTGGYLKTAPANPVWPDAQPILVSKEGSFTGDPAFVIAGMPGTDGFRAYCNAINKGLGIPVDSSGNPPTSGVPLSNPLGCFKASPSWGIVTGADYVVYARI